MLPEPDKPKQNETALEVTEEGTPLPESLKEIQSEGFISEISSARPMIPPQTPITHAGGTVRFPTEKIGATIQVEDKALTSEERSNISNQNLWRNIPFVSIKGSQASQLWQKWLSEMQNERVKIKAKGG